MTLLPGKLPSALLAGLLSRVTPRDPRVLVGPGIGRDAAVIDMGDRLLVAKMDPVTFAADRIGWYAVNVNANDIACMGARPAWFMATALLPEGADAELPAQIFDDVAAACDALRIELIGGHTEVTIGLDRPIIAGAMLGETTRDALVRGEGIVPGDAVLLTKGVAIEGTALLAADAAPALRARGVPHDVIERAARMLHDPGISVVNDARAACAAAPPRLLHDPTEGGVATALQEMATLAGATIRVDPAAIRVYDETRIICGALAIDPLGLLASGALLAIVAAGHAAAVIDALRHIAVDCRVIGAVESGPPRVIMGARDSEEPFPTFARDELARFFDEDASAADA